MKSRFSEEKIINILKEVESGLTVAEVCRKHNVGQSTYFKWKAKFGGMDVSEMRKLRSLEEENGKLKRLVADQALDILALKEVVSKKW